MPKLETIFNKNIEARKLRASLKSELHANKMSYPELEVLFFINQHEETNPSQIVHLTNH